jgi:PII-like signaling protein
MTKLQLTIYLNEADIIGDQPLREDIVRRLHKFEIAGATVVHGLMGYGKHGRLHHKRLFGVSDDRPVVIIAVDDESRIRPILEELKSVASEGLITVHPVEVV